MRSTDSALTKVTTLIFATLVLIGVAGWLGSNKAHAADAHQHDTNLSVDKFSFQHRHISFEDYNHIELGFKMNKWVGFDLRYAEAGDEHEVRPRMTVAFKWKPTKNLGLSYKNYFEYRILDNKENAFRYRGKIKAQYKFGVLIPYVSDRFNWTEDKKLYAHELEGGMKLLITDNISLSAFYRQITDEDFNKVATLTGTALSFDF